MLGPLLALTLAAPFPLPTLDGKPVAASEDQKHYRYPLRFEAVRSFYEKRFGDSRVPTVKWALTGTSGERVLILTNTDKADSWRRAVVRERDGETVVEVTPVLRLAAEDITGTPARPLVEFVFGRSPEVDRAVQSIDHTDAIRTR